MQRKPPLESVAEFLSRAVLRMELAARAQGTELPPDTVLISMRDGVELSVLRLEDARAFILQAGELSELSYAAGTIDALNLKVCDALAQAQQCVDSLQDALDSTMRPTEYSWVSAHVPPKEAGTYICRCHIEPTFIDATMAEDKADWVALLEISFLDCGKGPEMVVVGDGGETWDDVVEYAKIPVMAYRAGIDLSLSRVGVSE